MQLPNEKKIAARISGEKGVEIKEDADREASEKEKLYRKGLFVRRISHLPKKDGAMHPEEEKKTLGSRGYSMITS